MSPTLLAKLSRIRREQVLGTYGLALAAIHRSGIRPLSADQLALYENVR